MTRCKICGLTNLEDALSAVYAGADALGFNFYRPSPRYISPEDAAQIIARLPAFVSIVGLFVNHPAQQVALIAGQTKLDLLQFHGDESGDFCRQFERPYIKAVGVTEETPLDALFDEFADARALLFDTHDPKLKGGTGRTFNWDLALGDFPLPVILAGGLNPENVRQAIKQVKPFAVDVSGGVEKAKGIKDASLIQAFINEVHSERKI